MKIIFTTDEDRNQLGFEARYRIVQNTKVQIYLKIHFRRTFSFGSLDDIFRQIFAESSLGNIT